MVPVQRRTRAERSNFAHPARGILGKCSLPSYLQRTVTTRPADSAWELTLVNTMCQLDSGNRNRSVGERLESLHRRAAALDRAVILLNDIIEVLAVPYLHVSLLLLERGQMAIFHNCQQPRFRIGASQGRQIHGTRARSPPVRCRSRRRTSGTTTVQIGTRRPDAAIPTPQTTAPVIRGADCIRHSRHLTRVHSSYETPGTSGLFPLRYSTSTAFGFNGSDHRHLMNEFGE
jgi:hypothetical protein